MNAMIETDPSAPSTTAMKDLTGVAINGENLYVSDYTYNRILIFSKQ